MAHLPHHRRKRSSETPSSSSSNNEPHITSPLPTTQLKTETLQEFFSSASSTASPSSTVITPPSDSPTTISVASPSTPAVLSLFDPSTTTASPTSSPTPIPSQPRGLTLAGKAGIGVGASLAGLFLLLSLIFFKPTRLQKFQKVHSEETQDAQDTRRVSLVPEATNNIVTGKFYVSKIVNVAPVRTQTEAPRPGTGDTLMTVSAIEETFHSPVDEPQSSTGQSFSNEVYDAPRPSLSSMGSEQDDDSGVHEMDGGIWPLSPPNTGQQSIRGEGGSLMGYVKNLLPEKSGRWKLEDQEGESERMVEKDWNTTAIELQAAVPMSFLERDCQSSEGSEAPRSNFSGVESDGPDGPFEMDSVPPIEKS